MVTFPISKSRLLVRGHFVRGYFVRGKATYQVVQVMAAVNGHLSTAVNGHLSTAVNGHLPKPKHYYQRQHLQHREALVQ
jgi:hypothetical protein